MAFYKKENNGSWSVAYLKIILPDNTIIDENNKENNHSWTWHDTPPQEYLDWVEEQNNEEE